MLFWLACSFTETNHVFDVSIGDSDSPVDSESTIGSEDTAVIPEPEEPADSGREEEPASEPSSDWGEEPIVIDDPYCPENMVSIRDPLDEPVFCIDIFEISVDDGELGNKDQGPDWPDGSTTAMAISAPLQTPVQFISWYQAVAVCQNAGKYLCSSDEWIDACDGTYGSGGWRFPFGDTWEEGRCRARLGGEEQVYEAAMPTGSATGCRSDWGTYDQIGNLWEWTDPMELDSAGLPTTHKRGASFYSGGGNIECGSSAVTNHPPEFGGVIGTRCCATPVYPSQ